MCYRRRIPAQIEGLESRAYLSAAPPAFAINFLSSTLPASVVGGHPIRGTVRVTVEQIAGDRLPVGSRVPIVLTFDPTDSTNGSEVSAGPTTFVAGLLPGRTKTLTIRIAATESLNGTYNLTTSVDPANTFGENDDSANKAASPVTYEITSPYALLDVQLNDDAFPSPASPGDRGTAEIHIDNIGNTTASGAVIISLFAHASDGTMTPLASTPTRIPVVIGPGKSRTTTVHITVPQTLSTGLYWVAVATESPSGKVAINDPLELDAAYSLNVTSAGGATGNYFTFSQFVATNHSGSAAAHDITESGTIDVSGESSTYMYTDAGGFATLQIYGPSSIDPFTALSLDFDKNAPATLNGKTLRFLASPNGATYSGSLDEGGTDVPDAFSSTTAYFKLV